LTFAIEPGATVALVGPSGSGKSTVADLLLRFVQVDKGMLTVDGIPLAAIPAGEWLRQVAWVPQNPYLFHATVLDNLRLARPEATLDQVRWACRQAHIDDFFQDLPLGYETPIGEQGSRLSGGQAQRVALARAFLQDAPLLVLDEPTANLDPEQEEHIRESIHRLLVGRTALIIAHRLTTVRDCDQIVVLDSGRLVETGSHTELINRRGLYHRLVSEYQTRTGGWT
jgi:ABC-type multidrug transport system fused ATPase/permease subunit